MPAPHLDRSIKLEMQGDWGLANLHRICGWIAQTMSDLTGPQSQFPIWTGGGAAWGARWVGNSVGDLSFTVPACAGPMAIHGTGLHEGERFPFLRSLGTLPQTDRLLFAVDAGLGVSSFEELHAKKPPIRISTAPDDNANTIGFAVQRALEIAGLSREVLRSWGGDLVESVRPDEHIAAIVNGTANAVLTEAIMTPWWSNLADSRDLRFLSFEEPVLAEMEARYSWPRATVRAGYLRGITEEIRTLDFSDFLIVVREDMPDDIAYAIAWCLVETREELERQYRHLPPERSPVTYPLEPAKIATAAIPLHPGAARYYAQAGLIAAAERQESNHG